MQFKAVTFGAAEVHQKSVVPAPATVAAMAAAPKPSAAKQATIDVTQNLLKHIPGEASGFYLLTYGLTDKTRTQLGLIFALSLILLLTVRILAAASVAIIISSVIAFLLWMVIFDEGFLHVIAPSLMPPGIGAIVAFFYSAMITVLASAGKIK